MASEVRTDPAGLPRHIVAATDFSSAGDEAEQRAALLASESGARLSLAHVVPTSLWEDVGAQLATLAGVDVPSPAAMREEAKEQLERRAGELAARFAIACDARVAEGRPAAGLARIAAEEGADLLVVGARGTSALRGARDILVGSTAQKLLRVAPCPVLVVKRTAASPYRRVLAPTDYSTPARRAVRLAAAWFPAAQLHLAHAFELPFDGMLRHASIDDEVVARLRAGERDQLMQRLADWADASDVAPPRRALHVEHGYAPKRIEDWIESTRADVLVIAAHGKSELEVALLGSVTMHVVLAASCDVLLIRGAEAN
jgi:nucleotide-binding universal stress UspA family protein